MCGTQVVLWESLRNLILFLMESDLPDRRSIQKSFDNRVEMIYELVTHFNTLPIELLLLHGQKSKCSDPRDKVYAILNLLAPEDRKLGIVPDYSLTTSQVYQDVVKRYIRTHGSLRILGTCEMCDSQSELPTWVPNWLVPNAAQLLYNRNASGSFQCQTDCSYPGILRVVGISLGVVSNTKDMPLTSADMTVFLRENFPGNTLDESYICGGSLLEAYCGTLCCDCFKDTYEPPIKYFAPRLESMNAMSSMIADKDSPMTWNEFPSPYIRMAMGLQRGRSFFTANEGYTRRRKERSWIFEKAMDLVRGR
ncbi:hypothetical protein F5884DRAFT_269737 [Xylogone sp. PMI_703]|nr:hypothetical protein F5884DRAFT_269737 [Xylogone sp. PMI_703]